LSPFKKIGSVPMMSHCTPKEQAEDVDGALSWLCNRGKGDNTADPQKKAQKPEEHACDIEGGLDWVENQSECST
jgi:hypothetical protein